MAIEHLEPKSLWENFSKLCQIPRPSGHLTRLNDYLFTWADQLNLEITKDKVGNIVIRKPATEGMENKVGVILQAHLDMVPQQDNTVSHDFEKDPIQPYVDGEWVTAKGTTLGADNGIGLAAILAILEAKDIAHGPIEALFTVDEETAMVGAEALDKDILKGSILFNTDSEHQSEITVGCAGGADINVEAEYEMCSVPEGLRFFKIDLSGLVGGHSGNNIADGRGNAIQLMARMIKGIPADYYLNYFKGGTLRNAIPRDASAVIGIDESHIPAFKDYIAQFTDQIKQEFLAVEPHLVMASTAVESSSVESVMSKKDAAMWLNALHVNPSTARRMSTTFSNVVETSNNLAIAEFNQGKIHVANMTRSLINSARDDHAASIVGLYENIGAKVTVSGVYPGWQPNAESAILHVVQKAHQDLFGEGASVNVVHAGLECGLLGEHYPNWDMVSFGPSITGAHSPDERVNIQSVAHWWRWLKCSLENVSEVEG